LIWFAKGEVSELKLELPMFPFPQNPQEPFLRRQSTLLASPKNPRSIFLPQWAALKGHDGAVIHRRRAQCDRKKEVLDNLSIIRNGYPKRAMAYNSVVLPSTIWLYFVTSIGLPNSALVIATWTQLLLHLNLHFIPDFYP
jgi:hypothetical protein